MKTSWTKSQYSVFRALLGSYLCVHFVHLLGWSAEVFSSRGCIPDGNASPLLHLFPNVLALCDAPGMVWLLITTGAVASACLAAGIRDRAAAVVVWYIWACLFGRNPLIANPSLPYIGWMLLAHACLDGVPSRPIHLAAWIVLATSYSYSGCAKLTSASWLDGSAVQRVLESPLARPGWLRELALSLPAPLLQTLTWGSLALEIGFLPLALSSRARPWAWAAMLAMHLGLILLIDFADLSVAMVLFHLFTFDPGWLRPRPAGRSRDLTLPRGQPAR